MEIASLMPAVAQVVRETGAFIRTERQRFQAAQVEYKAKNDLVSYVDRHAETLLQDAFAALIPGCGFINEETGIINPDSHYRWVIDPLDGTTNFIYNIPFYSISVGLMDGEEVVLGCVYEICHDELYTAVKGQGAFMNDQPIAVRQSPSLSESLIAFGSPHGWADHLVQLTAVIHHLMPNTRGMRRLGSAAIDLVYTAAGRFDAYFEANLNPWDVAGGSLIVQEAGGIVTDFHNGNNFVFGRAILAASPAIHPQLLAILQNPPAR
jgi:myo-inositol-1(or 4)-monophosphatase